MARLTYGGWMFLIPMGLWVGAEYFAPPQGLLATIVPDLRKEQARWLRLPVPEHEQAGSGTAVSGENKKGEPTRDTTAKGRPAQPQTESDDPFVVVEDAPATKTSSRGKTPPTPNKSADGYPFEVIKDRN